MRMHSGLDMALAFALNFILSIYSKLIDIFNIKPSSDVHKALNRYQDIFFVSFCHTFLACFSS